MDSASPGRGRWVLVVGAIVVVGSCFLQWWQVGGGPNELARVVGTGFTPATGPVYPMFLFGLATLLLATLPFASERSIGIEQPVSYLGLWSVEFGCFVWTTALLAQANMVPFPPLSGIGFWLAIAGLGLQVRGVFELFEERRRRLY